MKKEQLVSGFVGFTIGVIMMYFFGDKVKSMLSGFVPPPSKAK